jgi:hypothetical protein
VNNLRGYVGCVEIVFDKFDPEKWLKIEIECITIDFG